MPRKKATPSYPDSPGAARSAAGSRRPDAGPMKQGATQQDSIEQGPKDRDTLVRACFELGMAGMAVLSPDLAWLEVNPRLCAMLGYDRDTLLTKKWVDIVEPQDRSAGGNSFEAATAAGTDEFTGEQRLVHRDGRGIQVSVSVRCVRDHHGGVERFLVLLQDVTEARASEVALRDSEARFRDLYDDAPICYHELDTEGRIIRVNRTERETLGYAAEEMVGRHVWEFVAVPEIIRQAVRDKLAGRRSPGRSFERVYRRKDGSHLIMLIDDRLLTDGEGQIVGIRSTMEDITARKRVEEELTRYRGHLEELVEQRTRELAESREQLIRSERLASVGTLAAGIAHEINNPIGGILLAAQNVLELRKRPGKEELQTRILKQILDAAEQCGQIIRSVLQFARQETTEKWPKDLNEVVTRAVGRTSNYVEQQRGVIEQHLGEGLPTVALNPLEMEQVIVNLVRNAVQAGPAGVRVRVETRHDESGVQLIVKDNGCGIAEEHVRHIFDPFFTTRRERGGTGLGLSIVHGIITGHGGNIEVTSRPDEGTAFTITLPLADETPKES